ncbi:hypothetical protein BBP40_011508 [Aspergillus hancockii]|nr:hypothetical protein BBP40_011508 [Aspergillus hancockii]
MAQNANYQVLITSESDKAAAAKRRTLYLRPFILFYLNSLFAEVIFLAVGILVMTGTRDLFYKVTWTLVFCPLGMGGAMGGIISYFIVDQMYGRKAVQFTAWLSLLMLGNCNYLCYNLDRQFGWFGAEQHPWWFHWRYPMIYAVGYVNGWFMFTDKGQRRLAALGL